MSIKRDETQNYIQPAGHFTSRKLEGFDESIEFLADYKYRIWYNDQMQDFALHKHSSLEIIICSENIYTVTINDQVMKMRAGDILFVPPHSMHQITAPETGARFIMLFDLEFLKSFYTHAPVINFFSKPHQYSIASHPHIYPTTYAILMRIVQYYFSDEPMSEISIYSSFLEMLTIIMSNSSSQPNSDNSRHTVSYDKFVNILSYIDTNYAEDLTLQKVASAAGFSKYHFARLFKQYTGTTFYEYLCHKRILVSQELLTKSIPVTDIAFQTGFNNLTTFCRCFKKYVGCSPTQYRSKFEAEEERAIAAAAKLNDTGLSD